MTSASKACAEVSEEHLQAAQTIWDYMHMHHKVQKSDVIIALGSNDLRTAEKAADLFLQGMGDWLVMSGNCGVLTRGIWPKPEAEVFCEAAVERGVPRDKILLETKSTNSYENVIFTCQLLKEINIDAPSVILVSRTDHERRAYATFMKNWNGQTEAVYVTSQRVTMLEYAATNAVPRHDVITELVGEFQRLTVYAERGFIIPQNIPMPVWDCYKMLRESGRFDGWLLED